MNVRKSTLFFLAAGLLLLFSLSACGGAAPMQVAQEAPVAPASTQVVEKVVTAATAQSAPEAPQEKVVAAPGELLQPPSQGRMIIKDANLNLLVENADLALERITSLAADRGGYILSSRSWLQDSFRYAELRMGIPSANFEVTLNDLRRIAIQVLNEEASGQDVSAEYADLSSRLVNLEATAARVREFLAQAKTVEESLKINAQLSDLEGQIEQVKGQMKFYEGRAAYSTITVVLTPQIPTPTITPTSTPFPTPTPTPGWNPANTFRSASTSMTLMLQGLIDILIWAVLLLWPYVLVGVLIWYAVRRYRRAHPKAPARVAQPPPASNPPPAADQ